MPYTDIYADAYPATSSRLYVVQSPGHAGMVISFSEASSGDLAPTWENPYPPMALLVTNTSGAPATVLLPEPVYDGLAVPARQVVCPPGVLTLIPLPRLVYKVAQLPITYSAPDSVLVAVICIP